MKKTLITMITALMVIGASALAEQRAEETGTVTNGTFTYTVPTAYAQAFLRQIMIRYSSAVSETITIAQVKGSSTNTILTNALSSAQTYLWVPDKDVNLGGVSNVWRVTAPSGSAVPATVWLSIRDGAQ